MPSIVLSSYGAIRLRKVGRLQFFSFQKVFNSQVRPHIHIGLYVGALASCILHLAPCTSSVEQFRTRAKILMLSLMQFLIRALIRSFDVMMCYATLWAFAPKRGKNLANKPGWFRIRKKVLIRPLLRPLIRPFTMPLIRPLIQPLIRPMIRPLIPPIIRLFAVMVCRKLLPCKGARVVQGVLCMG